MKMLQELLNLKESFNDDDYYLLDTNTKKVIKNLGKQDIRMYDDPNEKLKHHIKDKKTQIILRGMKAKRDYSMR